MKKIIIISAMVILPLLTYCLGVWVGQFQMGLYFAAVQANNATLEINVLQREIFPGRDVKYEILGRRAEDIRSNIIQYGKREGNWLMVLPSPDSPNDSTNKLFKSSINFYLSEIAPNMNEILKNPKKNTENVRKDLQLQGDFNEDSFKKWEKKYLEEIFYFNRAVELTKAE